MELIAGCILVVDDHPDNLDLLRRVLTKRGYIVETLSSGKAALDWLKSNQPDLILLDINMPEMTGFEVGERIKENPHTFQIPIIFISALDDTESKLKAFAAGGVDYITKPFHSKEVLARVHTHLSLRDMQKQLLLGKNILEATTDAVSDIIILTDLLGIIIRRNQAAQERFKPAYGELLGQQIDEFFQKAVATCSNITQMSASPARLVGEVCFLGIEGWFEIAAFPVYLEERLYGYVHTIKDITTHKAAEENQRSAREFAEALYQAGVALNSTLDIDEILDQILKQIQRVIPHDASNILLVEGPNAYVIRAVGYERYHDQAAQQIIDTSFVISQTPNLQQMMQTGDPYIIPDTNSNSYWDKEKASGFIRSWIGAPMISKSQVVAFICLDHSVPNFYKAEHAQRLAIFAAQASMALENANLFEEVKQWATVDFLTGLNNRRHFFTLAKHEWELAQQQHWPISLILLDLDHLKEINTQYGHIVGGQSLQGVGKFLKDNLRDCDIPAVYGGDEFIILLPKTGNAMALDIAEHLHKTIASTPITTYKGIISITISLGLATITENDWQSSQELHLDEFIDRADQALYRAKNNGRNQSCVWKPD